MNISDLSKVANRKRMNTDVEKLREKVSRETTKIIKLKVAQDTAYWDLKEKLKQVENNHERLQQNMVEVQMQHETISGQYQDELRLRPETLNKLSSTREICDVLEDYSERLKETLSRCKDDQAALCQAYQSSGVVVREIKSRQTQSDERSRLLVDSLQEKVKLTTDHQSQLLQLFTASKQQADSEIAELKKQLLSANGQKDDLVASLNELNRKMDQGQSELKQKEESIAGLQRDIKHLIHEFNTQANEMKNTLVKQEKDIKEHTESNEALKRALINQEEFTKSMCDQNNQLQEKISSLEEENIAASDTVKHLQAELEEATLSRDKLSEEIKVIKQEKEQLEVDIADINLRITSLEAQNSDLQAKISALESEKAAVTEELAAKTEETNSMTVQILELNETKTDLEKKLAETAVELQNNMEINGAKINEMTEIIEAKDVELNSKAAMVSQLMADMRNEADATAKLKTNLQEIKKDLEFEKESGRERENKLKKQVEGLEVIIREKESDLSKQMAIILEARGEKNRLQEKIRSMQNTIDNIQKELTGRVVNPPHRDPPELDDNNAVMMTPQQKPLPHSPILKQPKFAVPRVQQKDVDSMLFNFLSDSSMDSLDPSEVNRRFEALSRGEKLPPVPLASLKRRAGVPAAQGGLKSKAAKPSDAAISLSQVRNDLKNKERTFFKNKRIDTPAKVKKIK